MVEINPQVRKAIYLALVAVGGILVVFNLVSQEQVDGVVNILGLLLGTSAGALAFANTPSAGRHSK